MGNKLQNKILKLLAKGVSDVFSPAWLLPLLLIISLLNSNLVGKQFINQLLIVFGLGVVPILLTYLIFKTTGKISDWDIRDRKQRIPIYLINLIIGWLIFGIFRNLVVESVVYVILTLLIWFTFHTLITLFWKISAHTGGITLFYLIWLLKYDAPFWWSIVIPLVAWSRVYRKNHTLRQAIMGVILAAVIVYLMNFPRIYLI